MERPYQLFTILLLTLLGVCNPIYAESDFRDKASKSIKAVFEIDNVNNFSLMRSNVKELYLYTDNLKGRSPIEKVICKNNASFNIVTNSKNNNGSIASVGVVTIGLCDSDTELSISLINSQAKIHSVIQNAFSKGTNKINIDDFKKYNIKSSNSHLLLSYFTITIIGHGVMISPTAIISSSKSNKIAIIQFERPPDCRFIENNDLVICTNLERTFTTMGLSLFN